MNKMAINPSSAIFNTKDGSTIFKKFSYSAAVRAGDLIFVAGQIGLNPDGTVPQDDETQIINAFDRLRVVLEAADATLDDVVELVSYHVGIQAHLARFVEIKEGYFREPFPAWTTVEVVGLARVGLVVEIKAIAFRRLPAETS